LLKIANDRLYAPLPHSDPPLDGGAIDLALDGKISSMRRPASIASGVADLPAQRTCGERVPNRVPR